MARVSALLRTGVYGPDGQPTGPVDLLIPIGYALVPCGAPIPHDALMYNGRSDLDEERWRPSDLVGEVLAPGMRLRVSPCTALEVLD